MKKRGRPSREPTDEERKKVKELVELESPFADIAKALNRSIPNLKKYFSRELFSRKKKAVTPAPYKITQVHREKVIRYIGCKMSVDDVARVLDLTAEQLLELFPDEIRTGQAKFRAKVLDELEVQMGQGVVGATNRLEAITVIPDDKDPGAERIGPNMGKKAAAAVTAGAAAAGGGVFAPPTPPKLKLVETK